MQPNGWATNAAQQNTVARNQRRHQQQELFLKSQQDSYSEQGWFAPSEKPAKAAKLDIVTHHQMQGATLAGRCRALDFPLWTSILTL